MATVAQVRANRTNARKSTGPRTAAGKDKASQNAIKHGLLAREAVIAGEDPEEFESYRKEMLEELAPAGAVETMLAERIVGLSWRLRRAERLQNAALAALDEGTPTPLLDARLEEWKRLKGSQADRNVSGVVDEDSTLGRVVAADFGEARVLDRMLMYERRIESSLYRTMAELRKRQEARQARAAAATPGEASRSEPRHQADRESASSEYHLQAGQKSVISAELASFGANTAGSQTRTRLTAGGGCPTGGTHAHAARMPDGVTTNVPAGHDSNIPSCRHSNPRKTGAGSHSERSVRVGLCGIGILPMIPGLEAHATVGSSAQIKPNPYQ